MSRSRYSTASRFCTRSAPPRRRTIRPRGSTWRRWSAPCKTSPMRCARCKTMARDFERAAKISYDLARQQLDAGNINILRLLTAQSTYLQAQLQVVQTRAARLSDTAALFQALGGGWWNRAAPPVERILNVGTGQPFTLIDRFNFY